MGWRKPRRSAAQQLDELASTLRLCRFCHPRFDDRADERPGVLPITNRGLPFSLSDRDDRLQYRISHVLTSFGVGKPSALSTWTI